MDSRIENKNQAPVRPDGEFVLYWMIAARRVSWNFALDRAVDWAMGLGKPLLVFEALRCNYRWASDRFHRFVLDGMAENQAALEGTGIGCFPYVEPPTGVSLGPTTSAGTSRRTCQTISSTYRIATLQREAPYRRFQESRKTL